MSRHGGSCLCGAVRFEAEGELHAPDACHCGMCRTQTGHYLASTNVPRTALTVHGEERVKWYRSSDKVRRGFCGECGSTLFWDPDGYEWIAVAMGAFDGLTATRLAMHIFVEEKGDYYEIGDGVTQFKRWPSSGGAP